MISKNTIKLIQSLKAKKKRDETGLFVVEGKKSILDIYPFYKCKALYVTSAWLDDPHNSIIVCEEQSIEVISEKELSRISFQKTPQQVLGLFYIPSSMQEVATATSIIKNELCLALDSIQNPGNLGTIIRLADWFGIKHIYCTNETVDVYSPKTVQATMGSLARVQVHYFDLKILLTSLVGKAPIYGMFLDGENLYEKKLEQRGLIMMGNEGNGISDMSSKFITDRLLIPNYPQNSETADSLNVAIATAITCSEFRRQAVLDASLL